MAWLTLPVGPMTRTDVRVVMVNRCFIQSFTHSNVQWRVVCPLLRLRTEVTILHLLFVDCHIDIVECGLVILYAGGQMLTTSCLPRQLALLTHGKHRIAANENN